MRRSGGQEGGQDLQNGDARVRDLQQKLEAEEQRCKDLQKQIKDLQVAIVWEVAGVQT